MSTGLIHLPKQPEPWPASGRFHELRRTVLNGVASENSKRNYALAMDELAAFCAQQREPISRALLLEFKAAMLARDLGPSTINVKLSAVASWSMRRSAPVSSVRKRRRR